MSEKRGSNRKYATLLAYRMSQLWDTVKMDRKLLADRQRDFWDYKSKIQRFRGQWARSVPDSDREWFQFWQELKDLEDEVGDVQRGLDEIRESLHTAVDQAAELFRLNKLERIEDDPLASMREVLRRAEELLGNNNNLN